MQDNRENRFLPILYDRLEALVAEKGEVRAIDVGCGAGRQAVRMAKIGCQVTAIDKDLPTQQMLDQLDPDIVWREQPVVPWVNGLREGDQFDAILCRNVVHFLPRLFVERTFLPAIARHVSPGGMVAISAYYQMPIPEVPTEPKSFYPLARLKKSFEDWDPIYLSDHPFTGQSRCDGKERTWLTSRLIMARP